MALRRPQVSCAHVAGGTPARIDEPDPAPGQRSEGRARGGGALPARGDERQRATHPADAARSARAAARVLRALRADLHAARLPRARRVHAGPEANHYVTVSHAQNFSWRDGHMGDLIPLLGDGLLTIDGEFHRRSRKIMLPAFHRERIEAATAVMSEEVEAEVGRWRTGSEFDLYHSTRRLALRIAMRALFGFHPEI